MSRELRLRIMSAVVLAVVVLGATWLGGFYFQAVAAVVAFLVYYEWTEMTKARASDREAYWAGWLVQILLLPRIFNFFPADLPEYTYVASLAVVFIYALVRAKNYWNPTGILYSGLSGISLSAIRGDDLSGLIAMLFIFAIVWGTDIAAYFTGRAIGGPKLAPAISPGKTWSGAIGGALVAVTCGVLLVLFYLKAISIWIVGLSLLLSILSQIGDLFESFIKRRFHVKDSSHLIPGHGGVMDRIDGLVFACFGAFLLKLLMSDASVGLGAFLLGASS